MSGEEMDDIVKNTRELLRHSRELAEKTEEMLKAYEALATKVKKDDANKGG